MHALVYFKKSNTTDVLKKSALKEVKGKKGTVVAAYGAKRYEGVILKELQSAKFLRSLEVVDGVIHKPKDTPVLSEKIKKMRSTRASNNKAQKTSNQELNAIIQGRNSIFAEHKDSAVDPKPRSKTSKRFSTSSIAKSNDISESNTICDEENDSVGNNSGTELEESEEEDGSLEESSSKTISNTKFEFKNAVVMKAIHDLTLVAKDLESICEQDKTKRTKIILKNLPAFKQRKDSVELRENSGVYIDPLDEADALRFKARPREMIRKLFLHLVGAKYLIDMTPKGTSGKIAVPSIIKKTVFWYVNQHAEPKIDAKTFTTVLSNQCETLRSPKQKTPMKPPSSLKKTKGTTGKNEEKAHSSRLASPTLDNQGTSQANSAQVLPPVLPPFQSHDNELGEPKNLANGDEPIEAPSLPEIMKNARPIEQISRYKSYKEKNQNPSESNRRRFFWERQTNAPRPRFVTQLPNHYTWKVDHGRGVDHSPGVDHGRGADLVQEALVARIDIAAIRLVDLALQAVAAVALDLQSSGILAVLPGERDLALVPILDEARSDVDSQDILRVVIDPGGILDADQSQEGLHMIDRPDLADLQAGGARALATDYLRVELIPTTMF
ncbi:hypothetical protein QAD02_015491 [Eretmocerus hayati]|uniref:Uncharacterized protein n=1 Tax=Eretmocerus hayati TaxID=131215 RepID=A0ACC2P7Y8_9HYME|nr:hypothetical protein QAD02_015491 [Eretmocerus hayati]